MNAWYQKTYPSDVKNVEYWYLMSIMLWWENLYVLKLLFGFIYIILNYIETRAIVPRHEGFLHAIPIELNDLKKNKQLVARVLHPRIIFLHTWPKSSSWISDQDQVLLIFETTSHQQSFGTGLCLKSGLLIPYVANSGWLQMFGPFHKPLLSLFPLDKNNK